MVTLEDGPGGGTVLTYDADAIVGGMIGGVGQRMLTGVSKRMADEFFRNVDACCRVRRRSRGGPHRLARARWRPVSAGAADGRGVFTAPPGAPRGRARASWWASRSGRPPR